MPIVHRKPFIYVFLCDYDLHHLKCYLKAFLLTPTEINLLPQENEIVKRFEGTTRQ